MKSIPVVTTEIPFLGEPPAIIELYLSELKRELRPWILRREVFSLGIIQGSRNNLDPKGLSIVIQYRQDAKEEIEGICKRVGEGLNDEAKREQFFDPKKEADTPPAEGVKISFDNHRTPK